MSSAALNGGVTEPVPTPAEGAEKKDTPSSEVPEKPSDANGETPASRVAGAEPEDNQKSDGGSGEEGAEDKPSEEKQSEPTASTGEKREHDEASLGQGDEETIAESTVKKPKVDEQANGKEESAGTEIPDTESAEKPAENASNPPAKKGPGRPKKGERNNKAPKKQPTPRSTEGIGSRTRSRAKAQA